MARLVFVDCEATGPCPGVGVLTEFGAVDYETRRTFHGVLHDSEPDPANPALSVLTGPAYDAAEVFGGFKAWLDGLGEGPPTIMKADVIYKKVDDEGRHIVQVDVKLTNQLGATLALAKAEVQLPRR